MPTYRVYCLDSEGKSVEAQSLTASNDEEAIRQASALPALRQCEVWQDNRLVAKITDFTGAPDQRQTSNLFQEPVTS